MNIELILNETNNPKITVAKDRVTVKLNKDCHEDFIERIMKFSKILWGFIWRIHTNSLYVVDLSYIEIKYVFLFIEEPKKLFV